MPHRGNNTDVSSPHMQTPGKGKNRSRFDMGKPEKGKVLRHYFQGGNTKYGSNARSTERRGGTGNAGPKDQFDYKDELKKNDFAKIDKFITEMQANGYRSSNQAT